MRYSYASLFTLVLAGAVEGAALSPGTSVWRQFRSKIIRQTQPTCLAANVVQDGSDKTGQEPGTAGIKAGQSPSATDPANFINFCSGQTLTNGQQLKGGSCNPIPMGKIPASSNMISTIILNPKPGDQVAAGQTFNVTVQTQHLDAGAFTNPSTTYYTAPQDLNAAGDIIGHCHVTLQNLGTSLAPSTPPDPTTFAFFKGIDDAGNGQGLLNAVVTGGLTPGFYRVCTMISAKNHQPVNMPIAQRGAQDDCTKFEVIAGGGSTGSTGNAGAASTTAAPAAVSTTGSGSGSGGAVAMKCGNLGGACPAVTKSTTDPRRPFAVDGNTFVQQEGAVQRSCEIQFNACADAFNAGKLSGGKTIGDCQTQRNACGAA